MSEPVALKRLKYRSSHRGCKETDLILGAFADTALPRLPAVLVNLYEQFLEESDADIWNWLTGKNPPEKYESLIAIIRECENSRLRPETM